jgi:hypothetical protein
MTSELEFIFVTLSCTALIALYCCVDEMRINIRQFVRMDGVGVGGVVGGVPVGGGGGGGAMVTLVTMAVD